MSDLDAARGDLAFLRGLVDEDWRPGVWSFGALYLVIGVVLMIAFVAAARRLGDSRIVELLPGTMFTLQGVAWIVVHTLRRQGWQSVIAWGWFAAAVGVGFVVATDWFAPFVAAAALALMVVPGLRMMRSARAGA